MDGTAKASLGYVSISFLCCVMPYWCASMFKLNLAVFAQNSCWLCVSLLSLSQRPAVIFSTVNLHNSIIMSMYTVENNCVSHFNLEKQRINFPFVVWLWGVRETQSQIWKRIHVILTKAVNQLQFSLARKSLASYHFSPVHYCKPCMTVVIHSFQNPVTSLIQLCYTQMFSCLHCSN